MIFILSGQEIRKGKNHRYVVGVVEVENIDRFIQRNHLTVVKNLKPDMPCGQGRHRDEIGQRKGLFANWPPDMIVLRDKEGRRFFLKKSRKIKLLPK